MPKFIIRVKVEAEYEIEKSFDSQKEADAWADANAEAAYRNVDWEETRCYSEATDVFEV